MLRVHGAAPSGAAPYSRSGGAVHDPKPAATVSPGRKRSPAAGRRSELRDPRRPARRSSRPCTGLTRPVRRQLGGGAASLPPCHACHVRQHRAGGADGLRPPRSRVLTHAAAHAWCDGTPACNGQILAKACTNFRGSLYEDIACATGQDLRCELLSHARVTGHMRTSMPAAEPRPFPAGATTGCWSPPCLDGRIPAAPRVRPLRDRAARSAAPLEPGIFVHAQDRL